MPLFHVLAGAQIIGSTRLESGDPPMGVAFGIFKPNEHYPALRIRQAPTHTDQDGKIELVLQAPDGTFVPCQGGVHIEDMSEELGPEGIEVQALGIPYPLYEHLFPELVQAYDEQFK